MAVRVKRADVDPIAVGASQVGAVLGCDPFTTPLALYRRKRRLDPEVDDNPRMRIGRYLEGPVVGLARAELPLPIRRNRATFVHPSLPLFATPDAFVGRDRLLEAKVVGRRTPGWDEDDELPCHVQAQAQAQLMVTGREACYVVALVGTELRVRLVESDPLWQEGIADAVSRFVTGHLLRRIEPDPLTFDERWAHLLEDRDGLEGEAYAGTIAQAVGDRLLDIRAESARLEDEEKGLRADLLAELTDLAARRLVGTGWTATLSERAGRVDWRAVVADLDVPAELVERHTFPPAPSFTVRSTTRDR